MSLRHIIECEDTPTQLEEKICAKGDESPEGELDVAMVCKLVIRIYTGFFVYVCRKWRGDGVMERGCGEIRGDAVGRGEMW